LHYQFMICLFGFMIILKVSTLLNKSDLTLKNVRGHFTFYLFFSSSCQNIIRKEKYSAHHGFYKLEQIPVQF
jgi:hypothetical protein